VPEILGERGEKINNINMERSSRCCADQGGEYLILEEGRLLGPIAPNKEKFMAKKLQGKVPERLPIRSLREDLIKSPEGWY